MRPFTLMLCLIFFLPSLLHAAASEQSLVCADLLGGGTARAVFRQIEQLNPSLTSAHTEPGLTQLESLYVSLKREEWRQRESAELEPELQRHLLGSKSRQFALETLSPHELKAFYLNALRSLYVRVAALWKQQEVRTQVGPVMSRDLESLGSRLMDTFFSPNGLRDRQLSPAEAERLFRAKPWILFPWLETMMVMDGWFKSGPKAGYPIREFSRFWDQAERSPRLGHAEFSRLQSALLRPEQMIVCCHSSPGCVTCPHNRRWLRAKDKAGPGN